MQLLNGGCSGSDAHLLASRGAARSQHHLRAAPGDLIHGLQPDAGVAAGDDDDLARHVRDVGRFEQAGRRVLLRSGMQSGSDARRESDGGRGFEHAHRCEFCGSAEAVLYFDQAIRSFDSGALT